MAKIDLVKVKEMIDKKFISVQKHPTADLFIYNYTEKAQYGKFWNHETLSCRGLIADKEGNIVARPFGKFFNIEEHESENIPKIDFNQPFDVYEKMDGSLGILYFLDNKPCLATRGSFTSEQAIEANKILQEKYKDVQFNKGYTYLFEIIYPQNRIVLDYGQTRDLILLAVIENEGGLEVEHTSLPFPKPKKYNYTRLDEIKALMDEKNNNQEGFVVRFEDGKRVKLKYTDYIRLHRLITGVSARRIWDLLRNNQSLDELVERVPEEFSSWVKQTINDLEYKYQLIEDTADEILDRVEHLEGRKEQAMAIMSNAEDRRYSGIVFKMLDKRPYKDQIWKMIRPEAEKPFKDQSQAL